jgi:hypothetical protein
MITFIDLETNSDSVKENGDSKNNLYIHYFIHDSVPGFKGDDSSETIFHVKNDKQNKKIFI